MFRPVVCSTYAHAFGCNLFELKDPDLKNYASISDFFVRELADGCRPIDKKSPMVSPADGEVVYFGPVSSSSQDRLEQIKGVYYSFSEFLGCQPPSSINPDRQLYQCIIYLAPGDCHRFYSPTDWEATVRRHFAGKLLSVRPAVAARLPGLYTLNERVVCLGKWQYGFMSFSAVGALGVGRIRISVDPSLTTNQPLDNHMRFHLKGSQYLAVPYTEKELPDGLRVQKGSEFGRFQFGSTIVLIFEAPAGRVKWRVKPGDRVKIGEGLIDVI
ncbi:unnamed protein product [Calicophoron daubneyi]